MSVTRSAAMIMSGDAAVPADWSIALLNRESHKLLHAGILLSREKLTTRPGRSEAAQQGGRRLQHSRQGCSEEVRPPYLRSRAASCRSGMV